MTSSNGFVSVRVVKHFLLDELFMQTEENMGMETNSLNKISLRQGYCYIRVMALRQIQVHNL